jgi:hypothetical protein
MGLQPTRGNENPNVAPRRGPPWRAPTVAAGVILRRATGDEESRSELRMLRARFLADRLGLSESAASSVLSNAPSARSFTPETCERTEGSWRPPLPKITLDKAQAVE